MAVQDWSQKAFLPSCIHKVTAAFFDALIEDWVQQDTDWALTSYYQHMLMFVDTQFQSDCEWPIIFYQLYKKVATNVTATYIVFHRFLLFNRISY